MSGTAVPQEVNKEKTLRDYLIMARRSGIKVAHLSGQKLQDDFKMKRETVFNLMKEVDAMPVEELTLVGGGRKERGILVVLASYPKNDPGLAIDSAKDALTQLESNLTPTEEPKPKQPAPPSATDQSKNLLTWQRKPVSAPPIQATPPFYKRRNGQIGAGLLVAAFVILVLLWLFWP